MEAFVEAVGWTVFILLVLVGLVAGIIAGWVAGRDKVMYMILGVIGAVALPIVLVGLGVGLLAAGGILAVLFFALVGAVILLALGRAVFGTRRQ